MITSCRILHTILMILTVTSFQIAVKNSKQIQNQTIPKIQTNSNLQTLISTVLCEDSKLISTDKFVYAATCKNLSSKILVINSTDFTHKQFSYIKGPQLMPVGSLSRLESGKIVYEHTDGSFVINQISMEVITAFTEWERLIVYNDQVSSFYDPKTQQQIFTDSIFNDETFASRYNTTTRKFDTNFFWVANPFQNLVLTGLDTAVAFLQDTHLYKYIVTKNHHQINIRGQVSLQGRASMALMPCETKFIVLNGYVESGDTFSIFSVDVENNFKLEEIKGIQMEQVYNDEHYSSVKVTFDGKFAVIQTNTNKVFVWNIEDNTGFKLIDETTKKSSFSSYGIINNQLMILSTGLTLTKIQLQLRDIKTGKLVDTYILTEKQAFVTTKIISNQKNSPYFILLIQQLNQTISYYTKVQNNKISSDFKSVDTLTMNSQFVDDYVVSAQNKSLSFYNNKLQKVSSYNYISGVIKIQLIASKNILVVKGKFSSSTVWNDQSQFDVFNFSNPVQKWHTNTFFSLLTGTDTQFLLPTSGYYFAYAYHQYSRLGIDVVDLKIKGVDQVVQIQNKTKGTLYDRIYVPPGGWKEWGVAVVVDITDRVIKIFDDVKPYQPIKSYSLGNPTLYEYVIEVRVKLATNKKVIMIELFDGKRGVLELRNLNNPTVAHRFILTDRHMEFPADYSEGGILAIGEKNGVRAQKYKVE